MTTHDAARAALRATGTGWVKAHRSAGQNGCVEINLRVSGHAGIRDSKLGDASPVIVLTRTGMDALLGAIADGHFDGPAS
ncbi:MULTISPECIES: DUF397 domain-containing protein [Actinosynnema]|uniref:DUF397 domain-containing protein n=1 Tax=Actinosynnema TaxID=40566 RepID=UPI0020A390EA|nr:DUF397 domain-containing protein [Actinosynnema pretiosum]MCP2097391.1 protein of unknown function (DUF397) [Actinosynnema pretiosum]